MCTCLAFGVCGADVADHVRPIARVSKRVIHPLSYWVYCNKRLLRQVQNMYLKQGSCYKLDSFVDMKLEPGMANVERCNFVVSLKRLLDC